VGALDIQHTLYIARVINSDGILGLDLLSSLEASTLDLTSGYWQVGMHPNDQHKTAFASHRGLFEFKVLPFGLCNAPAMFERFMGFVLAGLVGTSCLVYLDDKVVFSVHTKSTLPDCVKYFPD
jgi:hypothetical protein